MEQHQIVPDVLKKAPKETLEVTFKSGVKSDMGNILKPAQVKDRPTLKWDADPNCFYTLCLTDPDAPSRNKPKFREWHHWLIGNIPGMNVSKGEILTDYISSAPPKGSGLHRYVFVVYKQSGKLTFNETRLTNRSMENRGKFSIRKFAEKYKLGEPVAGNFYQAEWDDYVPLIYKKFK